LLKLAELKRKKKKNFENCQVTHDTNEINYIYVVWKGLKSLVKKKENQVISKTHFYSHFDFDSNGES